jgi:3-hydroxyacyl-[acyl-carrier-protein] dehydratase
MLDLLRSLPGEVTTLDFEEVRNILVHRFPLLMIDKVVYAERGKRIVAIKNVTGNEIHFLGHFPKHAIMPGVLIIEAMAQAAVILYTLSSENVELEREVTKYLSSANVKFLKPVLPGDRLQLEIDIIKQVGYAVAVRAVARVDDIVAKGELVLGKRRDT